MIFDIPPVQAQPAIVSTVPGDVKPIPVPCPPELCPKPETQAHRGSGRDEEKGSPRYSLKSMSRTHENYEVFSPSGHKIGRIAEYFAPELRGQYNAEPTGRMGSLRFATVEAAQAWLIGIYEEQQQFLAQQRELNAKIAQALVAQYGR